MHRGVRTATFYPEVSRKVLEKPAKEGESPVSENSKEDSGIRSTTIHEESCGKKRGPPRKAKYYLVTDRAEYCEGKVKRTPGGE